MSSPAAALVRDLHHEALTAMYPAGGALRPPSEIVARLVGRNGDRWWVELDPPDPDDHRIAHLERELCAVIAHHAPVAVALATAIVGLPHGEESVVVWAAESGGETVSVRVHTVTLWDGVLAPGPKGELEPLERGLADTLVATLRDAGGR